MRRRTSWGRSIGAALSAALMVGSLQLSEPAVADTVPAVADDPANPETVSAQPLPTTQIDGVVWSQVVVGNTVYVGGQFTTARPAGSAAGVNTVTRSNLLAYDIRTGVLNTSWAPSANGVVKAVTASPDGSRIYVGGSFTSVNGTVRRRIAAINASTGAVVASFNPNPDATVSAIAATDSTVYFGGTFGVAGGATRSRLAAFTSTGTLLPWAPVAAGGQVSAITLTPDASKVIVGGQFTTVNDSSNPGYGMAAIDPVSGALVPWAANAAIRNGGVNAGITSLTTDGDSIYATGYVFGAGGNLEGSARINLDGTVNWVEDCHGDTYSAFPQGGVLYKVGHAHYCGNVPGGFSQPQPWRFYRGLALSKAATGVARAEYLGYANWAGTKDPSILQWYPQLDSGTFTGQTQAAWSLAGNSDYVVAGGEFPKADGTAQQGLVRYARKAVGGDGEAPELSFSKFVPTVTSPGAGEALVSWQTNYDRDSRNLTYKVIRNGNTASPVYTVTKGSNLWDRPYLSFLDTGLAPGTTATYRIQAVDPAGNEARSNTVSVNVSGGTAATDNYAKAVLKDGPQSYWRLDESTGSTLADYTGQDPMTATAGVTPSATGAIDGHGSKTFAGTAGATAASSTLQEGPFWFSVEAWFQTSTTTGGRIVGFSGTQTGASATNQYDRQIYMGTGGQLNFGAKQSSNRIVTSPKAYNDGKWHHVVGAIGDSGTSLYVDGVRVGLRTDLRTAGSYDGYWRVGGDNLTGWTNRPTSDYFAGNVSDVAVYREPLTPNEVRGHFDAAGRTVAGPTRPSDPYGLAVYNSGPDLFWRLGETTGTALADSSQNGVLGGTLGGTALNGASAISLPGDHSVTTDGVNDYVATNTTINSPAVYSEETWFKTSTTRGGQLIGFGTARAGNSATNNDRDVFMTDSGKVRFAVSPGGVESAIESPGSYNDGAWHHLVASQNSTGMKLYLDGQQVANGPTFAAPDYSGFWRVGGDALTGRASRPTSDYFAGSFDEVAVYRRALSADEVLSHFTKGGGTEANTAPVAAFKSSAANLVASFDGSASSDPDGTITSYDWDFGDGTTGTGATPTHTYAADQTYQVTLTVTDNRGGKNAVTQPVTVKGNVAPTAAFTSSAANLTASFDGSTSVDPDGTITSYEWDFGDGSKDTTTGARPSHTYAVGGPYTVKLTVTDNQGATNTLSRDITVTAPPVNAKPTAGFTSTTTGLAAAFDGSSSADSDGTIASYSWDFGDSTAKGTGVTPSHTYAGAGTYPVTLTVTDNQGDTGTVTKNVTVSAPPVSRTVAQDIFDGITTNGWGAADTGGLWTPTGTTSNFAVNNGTGAMTAAAGATRAMALKSVSAADTDVVTTLSQDKIANGGGSTLWIGSRQVGTSGYRTKIKVGADGRLTLYAVSTVNNVDTVLGTVLLPASTTLTPGAQLKVRMQTQGFTPTTVRARAWLVGTPEPTTWQVTGTDSTAALQAPGGFNLTVYVSGSALNGPIVTRFDDVLGVLLD